MLARLAGTLLELTDQTAILAPSSTPDLAYEVLLPAYLARTLEPRIGSPIELVTIQYLESLNQGSSFIPRLIGFASAREREFFELLTSVKGLGNKRALRAMALEPSSIARAIAERDNRFLQRLPEIGPKLADLIIHELKSKVDTFALLPSSPAPSGGGVASEASDGGGTASPVIESKPRRSKSAQANSVSPSSPASHSVTPSLRHSVTSPPPPVRATVDALIALGESPLDAERMVARALDTARAASRPLPSTTDALLAAAYASR